MSLICFRCFRTRSHVSDSREFQDYPLLTEGFHVFDCTWTMAEAMLSRRQYLAGMSLDRFGNR